MLPQTLQVALNFQSQKTSGVCHRCGETQSLNAYGLCCECDRQVDEEYELLYQESLELDLN